ncbi:Aste57867_23061 [Aphanomyces stellatus]|uniref:Aste57867_23061 protein n=1 Tax=Aphanomyces stellatus TaxID=120398 RepID=A0A485LLQ8_9STRA|nr:hypothetical protein As57867_022990 [Aphanomyces stellatus]VFT99709.1 Aste57867_23061 [Aphanomyces stellatus]
MRDGNNASVTFASDVWTPPLKRPRVMRSSTFGSTAGSTVASVIESLDASTTALLTLQDDEPSPFRCPWVLQLHPDTNLSDEQEARMKAEGLFAIDVEGSPHYGMFGLERDAFERVFGRNSLAYANRWLGSISLPKLPTTESVVHMEIRDRTTKRSILVNGKPIGTTTPCPPVSYMLVLAKDVYVRLEEGDDIVLIRSSSGFQIKYTVVKREYEATIGVLFASPLVEYNPAATALPELDFRSECAMLQKCLRETAKLKETIFSESQELPYVHVPRPIRLRVHFATKQTFQHWSRGLQVLHFSGHGNDHCVYFEDPAGVAVPITPDQVADLLPTPRTLQLVFVASCASANMAQAFVDHGVPHVVGTKPNSELEDKAAIAFTRCFYETLAQGRSVAASFAIAQNAVASLANTRQPHEVAQKFELLPPDASHDDVIFPLQAVANNRKDSPDEETLFDSQISPIDICDDSSEQQSPPMHPLSSDHLFRTKLAAPRVGFGGRNLDLHKLLVAMKQHRLVTVTGPDGVGKTQLATAAAWFVDLREPKPDRVRFCHLKPVLEQINNDRFEVHATLEAIWHRHFEAVESAMTAPSDVDPTLIVLDECDAIGVDSKLQEFFEQFLARLLSHRPDVRIVVTTCFPLYWEIVPMDEATSMELGPLELVDGAKLLQKILNRSLGETDYMLLEMGVPAEEATLSTDQMARHIAAQSRVYLETKGMPHRIVDLVDRLKFQKI